MDIKINQLKTEFTEIIDLRSKALSGFDKLKTRINILKGIYTEYIKNNKQTIYLFGLDSFHFQGQLIDIEYNDLTRHFLAISNRMYCEYYKLYKIIIEYMNENMREFNIIEALKMDEKIPVYRDIEPFKQYEFDHVIDIHNHIIVLLNSLFSSISHKKHQLKTHLFKNKGGLNTDNFVLTFKYNILILKNKTEMFMGYLSFFHKLHIKYLKRVNQRIDQLNTSVTTDINFEDILTNDTNNTSSDSDSDSDDSSGGGSGSGGGGDGSHPIVVSKPEEEVDEDVSSNKIPINENDAKSIASSITTSSKNDTKQSHVIKPKTKKPGMTKEDINKIKKIDTFFQSKPLAFEDNTNIAITIQEQELVSSDVLENQENILNLQEPDTEELVDSKEPDTEELVASKEPDSEELVASKEPDSEELVASKEPDSEELVDSKEHDSDEKNGNHQE